MISYIDWQRVVKWLLKSYSVYFHKLIRDHSYITKTKRVGRWGKQNAYFCLHGGWVRIFDILGEEIRTLFNGYCQSGSKIISWDGKDFSGKNMGAGMYIYQLETKNARISKKMVLIK